MKKRQIIKMIFSAVLPPVLVIALFAVAVGAFIIPAAEDALMQKKRDMIQAIVMSSVSILERHAKMVQDGLVTREASQRAAITEMRALRYGADNKDYLWITDLQPVMLMHPYFPDLEGSKLDRYTDKKGRLLFVEAVNIAVKDGEGYINYMWPRQNNINEPVPKLSYVRLFKPWGWVVGSGIYLDDVHAEMRNLTLRLLTVSSWIGAIVLLLLLFIIRHGWNNEKGRRLAEQELIRTSERYQALAHASGEILFLTINGMIAGANKKACEIVGLNEDEIITHNLSEFINGPSGHSILAEAEAGRNVNAVEAQLKGTYGIERVLLTAEHALVHNSPAIMYAGYTINHENELPDSENIYRQTLARCGIGILILENSSGGKIINADSTSQSMFEDKSISEDTIISKSGRPITGRSLRDLFMAEDADRLFLQLNTDGKVDGMLVNVSGLYKMAYLKLWASLIDNKDAKGQVVVYLFDITESQSHLLAAGGLLSEYLSPLSKVQPDDNTQESLAVSAYEKVKEQYIKDRVILKYSVKIGLNSVKIIEAASNSINRVFKNAVQKTLLSLGDPPCRYALIAFGSIGRFEPTLNADQDTALIYESSYTNNSTHEYFKSFGRSVTSICSDAGISPCNAGNTAANPKWCMSLAEWEQQFSTWIKTSQPEDLILLSIFFDFRTISGFDELALHLRSHVFSEVGNKPSFLYNLAQDTLSYRPPSDLFGRIRSDGKAGHYINLKGAMLHFVNFARIYALRNSVHETNTIKRLQVLADSRHIPSDTAQDTIDAWEYLLGLRLKNQVSAMEMNFPQSNTLFLSELGSWDEMMLKKATAQVSNLQKRLLTDIIRIG